MLSINKSPSTIKRRTNIPNTLFVISRKTNKYKLPVKCNTFLRLKISEMPCFLSKNSQSLPKLIILQIGKRIIMLTANLILFRMGIQTMLIFFLKF